MSKVIERICIRNNTDSYAVVVDHVGCLCDESTAKKITALMSEYSCIDESPFSLFAIYPPHTEYRSIMGDVKCINATKNNMVADVLNYITKHQKRKEIYEYEPLPVTLKKVRESRAFWGDTFSNDETVVEEVANMRRKL